jgi:hypothetical protein
MDCALSQHVVPILVLSGIVAGGNQVPGLVGTGAAEWTRKWGTGWIMAGQLQGFKTVSTDWTGTCTQWTLALYSIHQIALVLHGIDS